MRPVCSRHFARMVAYCSTKQLTYYRCQVDECDERMKVPRNLDEIPGEPTYCLRCGCAMELAGPCTSDEIVLICPDCSSVVAFDAEKKSEFIPTVGKEPGSDCTFCPYSLGGSQKSVLRFYPERQVIRV